MSGPDVSEIRRRVLEQHKTIRDRLVRLEASASEVAVESGPLEPLRTELETLLRLLRTHMNFEDSVLPGLLSQADAWGEARLDRYREDHRQQRRVIRELLAKLGERDRVEVSLLALGFCALLRQDMESEERIFLSDEALRDHPVVVGQEAG